MSNAKIDNNREKTAIAVDDNGDIKNLLVDPSTGRLLISAFLRANGTHIQNNSKFDENREHTSLVVDGSNNIKPLLIDNRNGYLLVDILCE